MFLRQHVQALARADVAGSNMKPIEMSWANLFPNDWEATCQLG